MITADRALADWPTAMTGFGFAGAELVSFLRGGHYRISGYAAAVGLADAAEFDAKEARKLRLGQRYAEVRLSDAEIERIAGALR